MNDTKLDLQRSVRDVIEAARIQRLQSVFRQFAVLCDKVGKPHNFWTVITR